MSTNSTKKSGNRGRLVHSPIRGGGGEGGGGGAEDRAEEIEETHQPPVVDEHIADSEDQLLAKKNDDLLKKLAAGSSHKHVLSFLKKFQKLEDIFEDSSVSIISSKPKLKTYFEGGGIDHFIREAIQYIPKQSQANKLETKIDFQAFANRPIPLEPLRALALGKFALEGPSRQNLKEFCELFEDSFTDLNVPKVTLGDAVTMSTEGILFMMGSYKVESRVDPVKHPMMPFASNEPDSSFNFEEGFDPSGQELFVPEADSDSLKSSFIRGSGLNYFLRLNTFLSLKHSFRIEAYNLMQSLNEETLLSFPAEQELALKYVSAIQTKLAQYVEVVLTELATTPNCLWAQEALTDVKLLLAGKLIDPCFRPTLNQLTLTKSGGMRQGSIGARAFELFFDGFSREASSEKSKAKAAVLLFEVNATSGLPAELARFMLEVKRLRQIVPKGNPLYLGEAEAVEVFMGAMNKAITNLAVLPIIAQGWIQAREVVKKLSNLNAILAAVSQFVRDSPASSQIGPFSPPSVFVAAPPAPPTPPSLPPNPQVASRQFEGKGRGNGPSPKAHSGLRQKSETGKGAKGGGKGQGKGEKGGNMRMAPEKYEEYLKSLSFEDKQLLERRKSFKIWT